MEGEIFPSLRATAHLEFKDGIGKNRWNKVRKLYMRSSFVVSVILVFSGNKKRIELFDKGDYREYPHLQYLMFSLPSLVNFNSIFSNLSKIKHYLIFINDCHPFLHMYIC